MDPRAAQPAPAATGAPTDPVHEGLARVPRPRWHRARPQAWLLVLRPVLRHESSRTKATALLVVGVPAVFLLLAAVFVMPEPWQLTALRVLVIALMTVTPVLMWWLFLAAQRANLLNDFLASVQRLGLLQHQPAESSQARLTRIASYLQRFEATYGRLPAKVHRQVLENRFKPYAASEVAQHGSLAASAVPVGITTVALAIGWVMVLPPVAPDPAGPRTSDWLGALTPNATPETFAFLGAYFFSIQMLFRRYVRNDLRGSAYVAVVLRIVLSMIGIWVIGAASDAFGRRDEAQLLILGFVVGVFPKVVWQVVRTTTARGFKALLPTLDSRLPLDRLDGLTVWHESRLEEEDIENVPNMATADIVDLLVNTRFSATRVVDWVDQAILLTQVGPGPGERSTGGPPRSMAEGLDEACIRTASALVRLSEDPTDPAFDYACRALDPGGAGALAAMTAMVLTNPNLRLVLHWRGVRVPGEPLAVHAVPAGPTSLAAASG